MRTIKFLSVLLASAFFYGSFAGHAHAQIETQKEALKMISDFAGEICNKIPIEGHRNNLELNGEAKAELRGLLKKVANLGIAGKGKYIEEEYIGVLQGELAGMLTKNADCKFKVFESLKDKVLSQSPSINDSQSNRKRVLSRKYEIEPNNNFSQASKIENSIIYSGETDKIGVGRDYFQFQSNEGAVTITLDVEDSVRNYRVIIYNKTREIIKSYVVKGGEINIQKIGVSDGRKFISVGYTGGTHASPYKISVDY